MLQQILADQKILVRIALRLPHISSDLRKRKDCKIGCVFGLHLHELVKNFKSQIRNIFEILDIKS